ncbi:hypothetical protein [Hymenobacter jejuensis]|uniref:hypothetical protein n=1 Tax=Hymenobacter jejuensis TaxID=2502781 RepID=UPI0013FCFE08|nr:hypothetical protein [Hymenobacter jejuensis]
MAPAVPVPLANRSICVITDDSLAGQPFGAEPTIDELLQAGAIIVVRKPFANVHERGQVDTIIVLRHQGNRFEYYRAPDKDLLRHAFITNFQPTYGRHLQSGITVVSRRKSTSCQNLRIGDTERTNYISVTYSGSKISTVKVEPYVD